MLEDTTNRPDATIVILDRPYSQVACEFVPFEGPDPWSPAELAPANRLVDVWAAGQRFPDHWRRGNRWFDRTGKELMLTPSHFRFPPEPPRVV